MTVDTGSVEINIDIEENGIYIFDCYCMGKTRMFKCLRRVEPYHDFISTYTYSDKLAGRKIEDALVPNKYKLIMLDRYDMYNGDGADLINECAKSSIILIDCKGSFEVSTEDKWCTIEMSAASIEVTE